MSQHAPYYRRIIADAWHIAWTHKHLWVFGLFATVVGFGGVTEPLVSSTDRVYSLMPGLASGQSPVATVPGLAGLAAVLGSSPSPALTFTFGMIALVACLFVFAFLAYGSIGALVNAIRRIERGGDASFADDVKAGVEKFWRVLGVNVVCEMAVLSCFLLTAASLQQLMEEGTVVSTVFYFAAFTMFTCGAVGAAIVALFATCEVVVRNRTVRDAIHGGIDTVTKHWLHSLELAILLLASSLAIGIASLLLAVAVSLPFIFLIYVATSGGYDNFGTLVLSVGAALTVGLIALTGSLVTVFQASAWTLLWTDIAQGRHGAPKVIRLARKHAPRLAK